jgi:hypothetical protein
MPMMGEERTDAPWQSAASAWIKAKAACDEAVYKLAKARARLLELAGGSSAQGSGVCVARYFKAGTIDYSRIPELQNIALDAYRKAGHWESRVTEQTTDA